MIQWFKIEEIKSIYTKKHYSGFINLNTISCSLQALLFITTSDINPLLCNIVHILSIKDINKNTTI